MASSRIQLSTAGMKERLLAVGIEAGASIPGEFGDRNVRDIKPWSEVVKKAKIPVE